MADDGYSMPFKTPYGIVNSVIFSMNRKVPSEYRQKVEEFDKEKQNR